MIIVTCSVGQKVFRNRQAAARFIRKVRALRAPNLRVIHA